MPFVCILDMGCNSSSMCIHLHQEDIHPLTSYRDSMNPDHPVLTCLFVIVYAQFVPLSHDACC